MEDYLDKDLVKGKLMQILSHEIRSPLVNIKSFLETLYEYHFQLTDAQRLEFLEIATQETNRLVRLTNQSLQLSKLNSNPTTRFQSFCIDDLLNQLLKSYDITTLVKKISLHHKCQKTLPKSLGNQDLILQVLVNLLTNSIKFTYPRGKLVVKAKKITSLSIKSRTKYYSLRLDVLDTGIGFNKMIKQFSSKEVKVHTLQISFIKGNGIGLSVSREILDLHNNSHQLISKVNKGTTSFFNL
jgi:two-component system, OmpR family, sensor histidine kinase NblS